MATLQQTWSVCNSSNTSIKQEEISVNRVTGFVPAIGETVSLKLAMKNENPQLRSKN
jgi:hypothetical protein